MTNNTSGITDRSLSQSQASSTWAQLCLVRVPSLRYSPEQQRQQQHWQSWNQFGTTGAFLSVPIYTTDALPRHIHLPVCLWVMDPHSRAAKKNTSHGNEVLPQNATHPIQRSHYPRGPRKELLPIVKRRKLKWYGHVSCSSGLAKTIVQGTMKRERRQGRQKNRWEDSIREWTGLEFAKSQRAIEVKVKVGESLYSAILRLKQVSRCGLAVRRLAGKAEGPWFDPLRLSFLFSSKIVVYGHCLVTLPTQLMKH